MGMENKELNKKLDIEKQLDSVRRDKLFYSKTGKSNGGDIYLTLREIALYSPFVRESRLKDNKGFITFTTAKDLPLVADHSKKNFPRNKKTVEGYIRQLIDHGYIWRITRSYFTSETNEMNSWKSAFWIFPTIRNINQNLYDDILTCKTDKDFKNLVWAYSRVSTKGLKDNAAGDKYHATQDKKGQDWFTKTWTTLAHLQKLINDPLHQCVDKTACNDVLKADNDIKGLDFTGDIPVEVEYKELIAADTYHKPLHLYSVH